MCVLVLFISRLLLLLLPLLLCHFHFNALPQTFSFTFLLCNDSCTPSHRSLPNSTILFSTYSISALSRLEFCNTNRKKLGRVFSGW